MPSVVQAVPAAIALPVPVVPVLAGAPALAATEAAGLGATTGLAATGGAATGAAVAELGVTADEATVAKTPPESAGADVATDAAEVSRGAAGPPVGAAPALVLPQLAPTGGDGDAVAVPRSSRESPGAGNLRSVES